MEVREGDLHGPGGYAVHENVGVMSRDLRSEAASILDVETQHGWSRAHLHRVADPLGVLLLGHGAGGGVTAPDLVAATGAALSEEIAVVLIEQPYRVAGRRSPAPAHQLDTAWTEVVQRVRGGEFAGLPICVGGRSAGARVACRTAEVVGAAGVLCLAFPLQPPRRAAAAAATSRLPELDSVRVPTLVIQGDRDPFGIPTAAGLRTVVLVRGDHSLKGDLTAVADAARPWLVHVLSKAVAEAPATS
jgi:predicted alpha/beta-hydrolase family hydrolase